VVAWDAAALADVTILADAAHPKARRQQLTLTAGEVNAGSEAPAGEVLWPHRVFVYETVTIVRG
jgi:hypothetical protein